MLQMVPFNQQKGTLCESQSPKYTQSVLKAILIPGHMLDLGVMTVDDTHLLD
jgi:hypothetical protein